MPGCLLRESKMLHYCCASPEKVTEWGGGSGDIQHIVKLTSKKNKIIINKSKFKNPLLSPWHSACIYVHNYTCQWSMLHKFIPE